MEEQSIRINKYLANLGLCARREVKEYLKMHDVTINGHKVREQGDRLNPFKDVVKIDGEKIKTPKMVYFMIDKPKNVVSTTADEFGRQDVTSLIPTKERIYPVGRLDKDTTGLLLLTNDGALTNLLIHPKYHVDKTYKLMVKGRPNGPQLRALRKGVLLNDGITAPAKVVVIKSNPTITIMEMTIHEGKNRQIRRMCETVGLELLELERTKFGPLGLGRLGKGQYRPLTPEEIEKLREVAEERRNAVPAKPIRRLPYVAKKKDFAKKDKRRPNRSKRGASANQLRSRRSR